MKTETLTGMESVSSLGFWESMAIQIIVYFYDRFSDSFPKCSPIFTHLLEKINMARKCH